MRGEGLARAFLLSATRWRCRKSGDEPSCIYPLLMGRAQGAAQAVLTGSFDVVFGERRGGRDEDLLTSIEPSAHAREQLRRLERQLAQGELADALDVLHRERALVTSRPLLSKLADTLAARLLAEQLESDAVSRYRGFFWLTGLRNEHADRLLADKAGLHVLSGEIDGDGWERHGMTVCGRRVSLFVNDSGAGGPLRGSWLRPVHRGTGLDGIQRSWNQRRCPDCEAASPTEPECFEEPGTYPLLDPAGMAELTARLRPRVTQASRGLWDSARPGKLTTARNRAKRACEEEAVRYAACELAARGERATRKVLGMGMYSDVLKGLRAADIEHPRMTLEAGEWEQVLGAFKPTATNARRFHINSSARMDLQLAARELIIGRYGYAAALDGALQPIS